ncbi:hypothetical protein PC116_g27014 [Phytophthora cactorum]|nr:hypothetical protein Pcac1_g3109 [Phytophthora cactorum]KAG4224533.1 hypothetical protein PC116_g27014 [Phytophthora cactorum]
MACLQAHALRMTPLVNSPAALKVIPSGSAMWSYFTFYGRVQRPNGSDPCSFVVGSVLDGHRLTSS